MLFYIILIIGHLIFLGVAVILTCVPLANVPPPVTDPPSPALAVKVYCLTICVGGVLGA